MATTKTSKFAGLITAAGINRREPASNIQSPEPSLHTSTSPNRSVGRRSNPDYVQISAYINKQLYRQVQKTLLDQNKREVSQLLEDLLTKWMHDGCPGPNP